VTGCGLLWGGLVSVWGGGCQVPKPSSPSYLWSRLAHLQKLHTNKTGGPFLRPCSFFRHRPAAKYFRNRWDLSIPTVGFSNLLYCRTISSRISSDFFYEEEECGWFMMQKLPPKTFCRIIWGQSFSVHKKAMLTLDDYSWTDSTILHFTKWT
jgi:hypothetical protein